MRPFGCHVTILNTLDHLGKFDGKSDDGFFVGYSLNSKDFIVYNIRTRKVEENLHVRFLEDKPIIAGDGPKWLFNIDVLTKSMNYVPVVAGTNSNNSVGTKESAGIDHSSKETGSSQDYILMPLWKDGSLFDYSSKNASNDELQPSSNAGKKDDDGGIDNQEGLENSSQDVNTAGPSINTASTNINTGSLNINTVSTRVTTALLEATHANFFGDETELDMRNITNTYLVPITPSTRIHKDHSLDHVIGNVQSGVQTRRMASCIEAMQDELQQFKLQKVWTLVDLPYGKRAIGTKWVYKNKKDERRIVIRNKARLAVLSLCLIQRFVVYQMDVKSAFLYGKIEEFYVCQPPGFEDPEFSDKVYKVEKALYGLHQALRAWYKTLSTYLLERGQIDKTLFIKRIKSDILLVQVYVDDIIFGSTKKELCTNFEKYLKGQPKLGIWYLKDSPFDLEAYTDSDYAGASLDRKSTTGGCQFLRRRLISWQCKKQTIVANSTTEAEYVAASSCCGQVLWIQNQLLDYGYNFMNTKIFIYNESTICIVKNPVFHSKTKHIEIRHHFIRDSNEKKLI
ncbi:putative ribonuclease H-like domain-containing protein [Tanacetum coccineum]